MTSREGVVLLLLLLLGCALGVRDGKDRWLMQEVTLPACVLEEFILAYKDVREKAGACKVADVTVPGSHAALTQTRLEVEVALEPLDFRMTNARELCDYLAALHMVLGNVAKRLEADKDGDKIGSCVAEDYVRFLTIAAHAHPGMREQQATNSTVAEERKKLEEAEKERKRKQEEEAKKREAEQRKAQAQQQQQQQPQQQFQSAVAKQRQGVEDRMHKLDSDLIKLRFGGALTQTVEPLQAMRSLPIKVTDYNKIANSYSSTDQSAVVGNKAAGYSRYTQRVPLLGGLGSNPTQQQVQRLARTRLPPPSSGGLSPSQAPSALSMSSLPSKPGEFLHPGMPPAPNMPAFKAPPSVSLLEIESRSRGYEDTLREMMTSFDSALVMVARLLQVFVESQQTCVERRNSFVTMTVRIPPVFVVKVSDLHGACALSSALHSVSANASALVHAFEDKIEGVGDSSPAKTIKRMFDLPRSVLDAWLGLRASRSSNTYSHCTIRKSHNVAVNIPKRSLGVALSAQLAVILPHVAVPPYVKIHTKNAFDACHMVSALQEAVSEVSADEILTLELTKATSTMAHLLIELENSVLKCENMLQHVHDVPLGPGTEVQFHLPPPPSRPALTLTAHDMLTLCAVTEAMRALEQGDGR